MKIAFELNEKTFTKDGQTIKYYVISRKLCDGSVIELPIKGDKAKLLLMSLTIENQNK